MEPIKTVERVATGYAWKERTWTYDEIFAIWDQNDDTALVPVLANRCIALEAELKELRQKQVDALDTAMECLKAVSGIDDMNDLERVVCATSTKPSEFIRNTLTKRAEQMQKQKQDLDLVLNVLDDIAWRTDWTDDDRTEAARVALEQMRYA